MSPIEKEVIEDGAKLCTQLECDGTVKVLSYLLTENHIPHAVMIGEVEVKGTDTGIPLHYWIELQDGFTVDYKAQMWLDENAPNGIFKHSSYPDYIYKGQKINMNVSKFIFDILTKY